MEIKYYKCIKMMTGSVNTSKTKGQSRLQRRAVENTL